MSYHGASITELEARRLLSEGGKIEIFALQNTYSEGGHIKGRWKIEYTNESGQVFAIRLSHKSEIKIYKTPSSIFNFCSAAGLFSANIPLKGGTSVILEAPSSD